jgi:hypothetical protein
MDGKPATEISLQHGFQYLNLKRVTEDNFPGLLVKSRATVTKQGVHAYVTIHDRFPCPGTMAGVIPFQGWVSLGEILFGIIWDFGYIQDISLPHPALDLRIVFNKSHHLVSDLLGEE